MTIEVIELDEQPDGTARLVLDMDNETARILIESAVVAALTGYVEKHESNYSQMEIQF
jgi:hypothetical protein